MSAELIPRMTLLIDENVPNSVAEFFAGRGHHVSYVRDVLPAGTPDPVVARIGDRLSAIVVTWDRDFEASSGVCLAAIKTPLDGSGV